jgi:hypothetical protein
MRRREMRGGPGQRDSECINASIEDNHENTKGRKHEIKASVVLSVFSSFRVFVIVFLLLNRPTQG